MNYSNYNYKKNKEHNPNQKAVALSYQKGDAAPQVTAKGQGYVAEKMLEVGSKNDVPIIQNKELVNELTKVDLGENIPPELYKVVAEILVFVSNMDKQEEYRRYGKQ